MTRSAIALPCLALGGLLAAAAAGPHLRAEGSPPMADVRFVTLDPGQPPLRIGQRMLVTLDGAPGNP